MKKILQELFWAFKIIVGCAIFAVGFNMFLEPYELNAGGLSGLAQVLVHWTHFGTVGTITAVMNVILFIVAGVGIGKRFLVGSAIGALAFSFFVDVLAVLPVVQTDPLVTALYGGVICGIGLGIVYVTGASTGGSDIIVRLLKRKWQNLPIGTIGIIFDLFVATLTGIAFGDVNNALYSGVSLFICGKVIDMVVYSFDNSCVAIIISDEYQRVAQFIMDDLGRGVTYLDGHGGYKYHEKNVVLAAIKKHQLTELKKRVSEIDPNAFVIVQEAHQVLGDGFAKYSKDSL